MGLLEAGVRRDRLGSVHSIDRVVMSVPGLAEAQEFFESFGLKCTPGNAQGLLDVGTFDSAHVWLTVVSGARKKLLYVRYGVYQADYELIQEKVTLLNVPRCAAPEIAHGVAEADGLWLMDPDGIPLQLVVAEKSSPSSKSPLTETSATPLGKGAAPSRSAAPRVHPRYLSHVLFFTADVRRAMDFYVNILGLKLSDRSEYDIAFLHGAYGSDHHLAAFVKSNGPGVHHLSWDVGSVDAVGLGAEQMRRKGHKQGWGVGRHVLGSNYFHYVRDPWGSYAEYSFDIDFIPASLDWPAANQPGEDSFYVWGPEPPEDFAVNYELPEQGLPAKVAGENIN